MVVDLFHFRWRLPICLAHYPIPCFQARLRVWVFLPELFQSAPFYDAHGIIGSHNENAGSSICRIVLSKVKGSQEFLLADGCDEVDSKPGPLQTKGSGTQHQRASHRLKGAPPAG